MENQHPAIELREVTKVYKQFWKRKEAVALSDVSFQVERGEIFGLLGPNGAGKTTTVKLICSLLRPSRGSIIVDGLDVNAHRKAVLRKIGVVLEGTRTSQWPLTVKENLAYYASLKNIRGRELKRRIDELTEFIGLHDQKNTVVRKLSRGMKQKLAICIALLSEPEVTLFDEPTTGLDVATSRAIKAKIKELTANGRTTAVITTHDMAVAQELCHRIAILNEGKLVALDRTENLISLFSDQIYEFRLANQLDPSELRRLPSVEDLESEVSNGCHLLRTTLRDANALYAIMDLLRARGAGLLSVTKREATLEDVFMRLTSAPKQATDSRQ